MQNITLSFLFLIISSTSIFSQLSSKNNLIDNTTYRIGSPIPTFKLTDLNDKKWNSNALKGKVVVINFWFTGCKPCIQEMPHLNELVKANSNKEVVFLAPAPENETLIKTFLKKYSFDYNIIPSSLDYINTLKIENFPTHLIIDKDGIIREIFIGYADDIKEKIQIEIDKLLN